MTAKIIATDLLDCTVNDIGSGSYSHNAILLAISGENLLVEMHLRAQTSISLEKLLERQPSALQHLVARSRTMSSAELPSGYLLKLPPKLRLCIYEYLYSDPPNCQYLDIDVDQIFLFVGNPAIYDLPPSPTALLRTCSTICQRSSTNLS